MRRETMKKSNRPLIIIVFVFILELFVVGALGVTFLNRVNKIEQKIEAQGFRDVHQIQDECRDVKDVVKKELAIGMVACGLSTLLVAIYLSHMVIYPLKKMIESKEKKEKAEETEIKTRLLHMTEGIIAFDINGKIDLINPAAKMLLKYGKINIFARININGANNRG